MSRGMQVFGNWVENMNPIFDAGQACPTCPPYIPDVEMEYVPKDESYNKFNYRTVFHDRGLKAYFSYFIEGIVVLKEDGELTITASGGTAATKVAFSTITYDVQGIILADGKEIDQQRITYDKNNSFYPSKESVEVDFIGSALFNLPKPEVGKRYVLLLKAIYNFSIANDHNKIIGPPMEYIIPLKTQEVKK